ncbi:uncharacterized protein LOC126397096 isoform X1 [Epinephelus moara]|uniref:uncharacterized protein LOC126397096 isoform X1 n=1 Tax=Epinephelus moara TaxID=300413 RepID=UPI00214E8B0D|nr:uncharacterized protein LOC126397096 isoform X1 [Epinephelus moara]
MSQTETQHPEASLSVPQRPARSESISAMLSGRMLLLSASCWLLVVLGSSKELIEKRSPGDTAIKTQEEEELTWMETVRDTGLVGGVIQPQGGLVGGVIQPQGGLIEALQEVLEKLKNKQLPSSEKKLGWVPACDAGEQCAVRKGSRIGKLCGCPGGTVCNFTVLKCL